MKNNEIVEIEKIIGYTFKDKALLERAFTHGSKEKHATKNYQSLEFLGDSILDFIIAKRLMEINPDAHEGALTRLRAQIVSREPLADEIAKQDQNNRYILSSSTSGQLLDKINERIVAAYMHRLAETTDKNLDMGKVRYVIAFAAAGITECFKIWFNHKSTITLEELCKHISDAVSKGVDWVSVTKA